MADVCTNTIAAHLNGARDEVIEALCHLAPSMDANLDAVRALLFALSDIEAIGRELDDTAPAPASVVALSDRLSPEGGRQ